MFAFGYDLNVERRGPLYLAVRMNMALLLLMSADLAGKNPKRTCESLSRKSTVIFFKLKFFFHYSQNNLEWALEPYATVFS